MKQLYSSEVLQNYFLNIFTNNLLFELLAEVLQAPSNFYHTKS